MVNSNIPSQSLDRIFQTERHGNTLVVLPTHSVMGTDQDQSDVELRMIVQTLRDPDLVHVVVDFAALTFFGTNLLGGVAMLWKKVRDHDGRLALCNVSAQGRDVLRTTRLVQLWKVYDSRAEAIRAVQSPPETPAS